MDFNIIPECYIDTNLIETIVPPSDKKRGYNHQKGCATVAKVMQEAKLLKDGFAVGIIDKDKKEIAYTRNFVEIADEGQLKLLKHPQKHHYFILIIPAMEKWILNNAAEVGINLEDYNLPSDLVSLCQITKKVTSKDDAKFKPLFKDLKKKEASGVVKLADWIRYLKETNFHADMNYFKK